MGFSTRHPEKKILGFSIVNYTAGAIFNMFFLSALISGVLILTVAGSINFLAGSLIWSVFTIALFVALMRYRDRCVRQEIDEGLHDPVWGQHIERQKQRERDDLNESNWITRPLFRFACFIGIHKKQK